MRTIRALGRKAAVVLVALAMTAVTVSADYTEVRTEPVRPGGVGADADRQIVYGQVGEDFTVYVVAGQEPIGVYQETNGCDDVQTKSTACNGKSVGHDARCVSFSMKLATSACSVDPLLP